MGRSKFVTASQKNVMPHDQFMQRIRKSLYYGMAADSLSESSDMEVSKPLAEYAADLFSDPHRGHSLNRLTRVAAGKSHATPCSLIMALLYLDRLNAIDPGYVRRVTPQELFVVSLMISTKFYSGHDQQIYLEDWAKEGNMTEEKLKQLEIEFLCAIDWNIYISNEQFFEKLTNVERILAKREGLRRGWLTYSELMQLLPSFTLLKFMLNSITVLAVSYAASVMTIAGAFFLVSQIPGTALYRKPMADNAGASVITSMNTTTTSTTMPTTTEDATQATPVITLRSNETNVAHISGSTTMNAPNASCSALNVEAELLKLEQQYCEEARLNDMRSEARAEKRGLQLPMIQNGKSGQYYFTRDDSAHNWLSIKSEYSDDDNHLQHHQQNRAAAAATDAYHMYEDCFNAQNVSVLWQLYHGVMTQTFDRLPELWFKFI